MRWLLGSPPAARVGSSAERSQMVRTLERGGQRVGCNESGHFRKRVHSRWLLALCGE